MSLEKIKVKVLEYFNGRKPTSNIQLDVSTLRDSLLQNLESYEMAGTLSMVVLTGSMAGGFLVSNKGIISFLLFREVSEWKCTIIGELV